MNNLPKKYIESMVDAQSQIIAQQQEIEELKDKLKRVLNTAKLNVKDWNKCEEENTKLKEEIRILKQYAEIARNDKHQRKIRLNEALEEIKELKNK